MKNLMLTNEIVTGKIYMVETLDGKVDPLRVLAETATHFIFTLTNDDSVEVFEKAKTDISGIFEVKEWVKAQEKE
jgi:hypothetical protein